MDENKISFCPDSGLMYLIQSTTNQSSDEILGFFYDFGKQVLIDGLKNMKTNQRSIRKDIQAMYPGTAIPFRLLVEAARASYYGGTYIYVSFPDNANWMDTKDLLEVIIERSLLGGSSLPNFEAPPSKTPKMYKELIAKVLKGEKADE